MSYQALYRRYRPQYFKDVIGQGHITTILQNQIKAGQASHAYLFCGSRGTGKTSTAKIFARALNCLQPQNGDVCGECEACVAMRGEMVDIIEIDAASNNGVDDVRALIEQARFTPLSLRYKVYIIDEVHMLTGAASNALLKILEEPPAHVVFLLATTEPQKLLATVVSRCQRFDFRRLSVADIVDTVRNVLSLAGARVDDEGLAVIARAADGGMRDALSLTDQCLAFCGNDVSVEDVYDVLGSMDQDFLFRMVDALIASDAAASLRQLDEIVRSGRDLGVLAQDLAQHMRALLLTQACGDCRDLLDCTREAMERYQEQAARIAQERLLRVLEQLTRTQNEMKYLGQPRVLLETMLVRACRPEDEHTLLALEDRMARMEALLQQSAVPAAATEQAGSRTPATPAQAAANEETEADDAPPWQQDEAPPVVMVPPKAPPQQNAVSSPKNEPQAPAPASEPLPSTPQNTATPSSEWKALQNAVRKKNMALFVVSGQVQQVEKTGNVLTVYFPQGKESGANMCNAPQNISIWKEALQELYPDLSIRFLVGEPPKHNEKTSDMADFFGGNFTISD